MRDLPSGVVTFLFTDIEGSTKLLHELGAEAYAEALAEHRRALREAFGRHGGVEVDTEGDAFFVSFPDAAEAAAAAGEAQEALAKGPIRVRIGLHTEACRARAQLGVTSSAPHTETRHHRVPPAGIGPATPGLGNLCSIH